MNFTQEFDTFLPFSAVAWEGIYPAKSAFTKIPECTLLELRPNMEKLHKNCPVKQNKRLVVVVFIVL